MESSDETCPICLNEMKGKVRITTECSHTFCFDCIATNTGINDNCPLCRQNVDIPAFKDCIVRDRIDTLEELEFENDVRQFVEQSDSVLARGNGRCYGDAALSDNLFSTLKLDKITAFDVNTGLISCQSGVLLSQFIVLAKILAHVVFPTPLIPVRR